MKKPNTQVRRNGGSKAARSQVAKSPDAPTGAEQKLAYLRAQSHESLVKLTQGYWDDPAARPVFNEWLASIPREVLENLAYFLMGVPPAKQGTQPSQAFPSWLKLEHLTVLNVLANNRSKFLLNFRAITALAREFKVQLKESDQHGLIAMQALGWVEMPSPDHWRITPAGRDVLQTFTSEAAALVDGGAR